MRLHTEFESDFDWTMPNVELVQIIFIYYNILKLQVDFLNCCVIMLTDTQTHIAENLLVAV